MKRTFGTPLKAGPTSNSRPCYRNKILDVVDFGEPFSPIEFRTPRRTGLAQGHGSGTSSSLASISPVLKLASSDEEVMVPIPVFTSSLHLFLCISLII